MNICYVFPLFQNATINNTAVEPRDSPQQKVFQPKNSCIEPKKDVGWGSFGKFRFFGFPERFQEGLLQELVPQIPTNVLHPRAFEGAHVRPARANDTSIVTQFLHCLPALSAPAPHPRSKFPKKIPQETMPIVFIHIILHSTSTPPYFVEWKNYPRVSSRSSLETPSIQICSWTSLKLLTIQVSL